MISRQGLGEEKGKKVIAHVSCRCRATALERLAASTDETRCPPELHFTATTHPALFPRADWQRQLRLPHHNWYTDSFDSQRQSLLPTATPDRYQLLPKIVMGKLTVLGRRITTLNVNTRL